MDYCTIRRRERLDWLTDSLYETIYGMIAPDIMHLGCRLGVRYECDGSVSHATELLWIPLIASDCGLAHDSCNDCHLAHKGAGPGMRLRSPWPSARRVEPVC